MPGIPLPVAFRVYEHGTTTPIEGVNVGVRNLRTREFRDSDDDNFNLLLTSSVGEGTFNASNFTEEYAIGDEIEITLNHNGLKDKIFITLVSGPMAGIVLTPCSLAISPRSLRNTSLRRVLKAEVNANVSFIFRS